MGFYHVEHLTAETVAENLQLRTLRVERLRMIFFRRTQGTVVPEHAARSKTGEPPLKIGWDLISIQKSGGSGRGRLNTLLPRQAQRWPGPETELLEFFAPRREELAGTN